MKWPRRRAAIDRQRACRPAAAGDVAPRRVSRRAAAARRHCHPRWRAGRRSISAAARQIRRRPAMMAALRLPNGVAAAARQPAACDDGRAAIIMADRSIDGHDLVSAVKSRARILKQCLKAEPSLSTLSLLAGMMARRGRRERSRLSMPKRWEDSHPEPIRVIDAVRLPMRESLLRRPAPVARRYRRPPAPPASLQEPAAGVVCSMSEMAQRQVAALRYESIPSTGDEMMPIGRPAIAEAQPSPNADAEVPREGCRAGSAITADHAARWA